MRRSGKPSAAVLIDDELERTPFVSNNNTISASQITCESLMILRPARSGDRVKGSPIPVDSCCATSSSSKTSQSSTNSVDVEAEGAPYFVVTTIRKRYVFIVETAEEAQEWVEAIKLRKFLSVKENMGHAPLTEEVRRMNQRASRLVDKKLISERKEAEEATGNPVLTPSF
eukprot:scaffold684_cov167-Ochromonas_danica.AAC.10